MWGVESARWKNTVMDICLDEMRWLTVCQRLEGKNYLTILGKT
jgi:hypothetical protein